MGTTTTTTTCVSTYSCATSGFELAGNACFKVESTLVNWEASKTACAALGATLATIDNLEQDTKVTELCGSTNCYIGLNDIAQDQTFVWADGAALGSYDNWYGDNPNPHTVQNCVIKKFEQKGEWDDVGCKKTDIPHVCRMEAVDSCA